eukprot:5584567-Prymnesium_polylepis.1
MPQPDDNKCAVSFLHAQEEVLGDWAYRDGERLACWALAVQEAGRSITRSLESRIVCKTK